MITIGCDPEFAMLNQNGTLVNADRLLPKLPPTLRPAIGRDGANGETWELRPQPSTNPREVVASIRDLLRQLALYLPETLEYQ